MIRIILVLILSILYIYICIAGGPFLMAHAPKTTIAIIGVLTFLFMLHATWPNKKGV